MPEGVLNISVVMPVYNAGAHVAAAVRSILQQTCADFQFIIINDGSTDDTSRIIRSFSDRRIRLVERENRGFAYSLNQGIALARGKYIARMDGDDIAYPDRLERQYAFMQTHTGVDILGGQADIIDAVGELTGQLQCPSAPGNIARCLPYLCPLCHPTYFVKKDVYVALNGYRDLPPVEDYDFLLRAAENKFCMENLPVKVLQYRKTSSGMTADNLRRTLYRTAMVQKMYRLRTRRQRSDEKLFSAAQGHRVKSDALFSLAFNLREKLMRMRKQYNSPARHFLSGLIFMVSLLHYQIALNSFNALKAAPYRK
jgi:glycosyltransferase involved in cell wall biosynthesis